MKVLNRMMLRSILLIALFSVSFLNIKAQVTNVSYMESDAVIANPERGFYHFTTVRSSRYVNLNQSTLEEYVKRENITMILRVFYIEDFVNRPISESYLKNMYKDFAIARKAGVKVIVRMAYTQKTSAPYGDAKPEIVLTHLKQLKEVFHANEDVIAVAHAGFIGAWGEWYYSDHYTDGAPHIVSEENWKDRAELIHGFLDAMPRNRQVQLRTPGYKMKIFNTVDPLTEEEAFSGSALSRVGHHNDCFVASGNDQGTYTNQPVEKPYLAADTKYTAMGGETCQLNSRYSNCEQAYPQMQDFHYSYLNIDYRKSVLNLWKEQGCYDDIERNMGYRYVLNTSEMESSIHPLGTFKLNLSIDNKGFANPYNPREVYIVLADKNGDKTYTYQLDTEITKWPIGEPINLNIEAGLPDDINEGEYDVSLYLPDASPSIEDNPRYAIQVANMDIFDAENGYNSLNQTLTVSSSGKNVTYDGDQYFVDKNRGNSATATGPEDIYVGSLDSEKLLFWGATDDYVTRIIEESEDGQNWTTLTSIPANQKLYYIDNKEHGKHYRYYLVKADGTSTLSNEVQDNSTQPAPESYYDIVTNGNDDDWHTISPIGSIIIDNKTFISRVHFDARNAHFALYGGENNDYSILINTDNNTKTGYVSNDVRGGMDINITPQGIFSYDDGWNLIGAPNFESEQIDELQIPFELLNLGDNVILPMVIEIDGNTLSDNGQLLTYIRSLAPDAPKNVMVNISDEYPDVRLDLTWDACEQCKTYTIEVSRDEEIFTPLKTLKADRTYYYHDFVDNDIYYYRIYSTNDIGISDYSDIVAGSLTNTTDVDFSTFKVGPNPVKNKLLLSELCSYEVYDLWGRLILKKEQLSKEIDMQPLQPQVYYVLLYQENRLVARDKVIKQ